MQLGAYVVNPIGAQPNPDTHNARLAIQNVLPQILRHPGLVEICWRLVGLHAGRNTPPECAKLQLAEQPR